MQEQLFEEDEYEITMSRASSNYSVRDLIRMCSVTSTSQEQVFKNVHQRFYLTENIYEKIQKEVDHLAELLGLHGDLILLLLNKYKWNIEKLNNEYFEKECAEYTALQNRRRHYEKQSRKHPIQQCAICCEVRSIIVNICGHGSCAGCWLDYLNTSIENQKAFIKCSHTQCLEILHHSFVLTLEINRKKYIRNLSLQYVKYSKFLSFCPGINCDYCLEDTSLIAKNVECKCGTKFCFKCGKQPHEPCNCKQVSDWYALTKKQNINQVWIKRHTKICPTCKSAVERAMGCNFIVCKCGESFCYHCSKKWCQAHTSHFKCPYQEKKQSICEKQQDQANKITRNYSNFLLLESIQKRAEEQCLTIDKYRQQINKKILHSEFETAFMIKSCQLMVNARTIIKWAHVLLFFKTDQPTRELMEFKLNDFKIEIDKFSYQIELFKRKIIILLSEDKTNFESSKGKLIKQFHTYREAIETRIKVTERIISQYLQQATQ